MITILKEYELCQLYVDLIKLNVHKSNDSLVYVYFSDQVELKYAKYCKRKRAVFKKKLILIIFKLFFNLLS